MYFKKTFNKFKGLQEKKFKNFFRSSDSLLDLELNILQIFWSN